MFISIFLANKGVGLAKVENTLEGSVPLKEVAKLYFQPAY
ncbi:L-lactate permease [Actinobacillus equuli]|nr:L-lactate permease [Actinobacillus equuli]